MGRVRGQFAPDFHRFFFSTVFHASCVRFRFDELIAGAEEAEDASDRLKLRVLRFFALITGGKQSFGRRLKESSEIFIHFIRFEEMKCRKAHFFSGRTPVFDSLGPRPPCERPP